MAKSSLQIFMALCLATFTSAFVHNGAARTMMKASSLAMKMDIPKAVASFAPAFAALPAFASTDALTSTMPLSLEVTFAAYLAVLLGTFVPVTFLIVLYVQSEARKSGADGVV
eukprot:CAMPEP_0117547272 /NCGR_PEP_ID=MMETSP0784-20121206/47040_1 /TAXON_ID=39447 /ORGANISM="" /LENGTH=112 /DNA_ID=CAMNT_0005344175 /DNA_START=23 /DNA_END=361 /DNA_ORIENTATION=-